MIRLQEVVTSNVLTVYDCDRASKVREIAMRKIFQNQLNLLRIAFHKWHNRAEQISLSDALDANKKRMLLISLGRFMKGNKKELLRLALLKFSTNAHLNKVRNFLLIY